MPSGIGMMVHVDQPAPGIVLAYAMECMGMQMATLQAFFYGDRAATAAGDADGWKQWLASIFPPPAEPTESGAQQSG